MVELSITHYFAQTRYFKWSAFCDTMAERAAKRKCAMYINTCVPTLRDYNVRNISKFAVAEDALSSHFATGKP